ncbi:hypothetical protein, partial [Rhizobium tropici]|uniref:hypothetical protein n=1 Tax=Rhizobium tropici TaxID=398 RepID=UPI001AEDD10A
EKQRKVFAIGRDFRIHFTSLTGIVQINARKGYLRPVAGIGFASHCQRDTQDLIDIERLKGAEMLLLDKRRAQAASTRQTPAFAHKHMRSSQA